ncbi:DNA repair protein rad51 [Zalerion maritima]|uniref:DNA repair protein rad51 n=1 Tax=Zalerion maritima TaxID=339359 RepID=A0AAD5RM75_9PEZI|nr:DNA repair protein rad51 [Zalerion maritima]
MASRRPNYLFKETRLNLEPGSPASIVNVRLPKTSTNGRNGLHSGPTSLAGTSTEDETFSQSYLASASKIYRRRYHNSPRSFLWRVLQDGTVLSLRAVDVSRQEKLFDAPLTLHLQFPSRIRSNCIAFADPKFHDALAVFVLDENKYLYSLMLRPECFRRRAATERGLGSDACKVYLSSAFSFKHPHRLVALTDELVVAALHDGGILKFERTKAHEGPGNLWKESHFNASSWLHGVRSMLPFKGGHTIRHGKINMEMAAAASMVTADFDHAGQSYLLSVCLDHRLRIWNLENGAVLDCRDLLNAHRDPKEEVGKWTVDPSQPNLIRVISEGPGSTVCLTYSPVGAGEFKFWRILSEGQNNIRVEDMFEDAQLQPPPPSNDIWTLADFALNLTSQGYYIWTLWKNNMSYRVQRIHVRPGANVRIESDDVVDVFTDAAVEPAETSNTCEPTDPTEKWLNLILYPGRFTRATLETALSIYERGLGGVVDSFRSNKGIAGHICSALSQTVHMDRNVEGGTNYEQYRRATETQWMRFYRLVLELDKQRGEALGLVHDPHNDLHSGLVWVVCTDIVSVVRECTHMDSVYHSLSTPPLGLEDVSNLVATGLNFVDGFSDSMMQICNSVLKAELFEESTKTDMERLQFFSDKAGFWRQLSDEDCVQATDALGGNFHKVTSDVYQQLFDLASAAEESRRRNVLYPLTEFGRKVVIRATQDTGEIWRRIFFSQLILLVHMEFEFDSEDDALHQRIDVGAIYKAIIDLLKRQELVSWLGRTEIAVPVSRLERQRGDSGPNSPAVTRNAKEETQTITALEGSVGHLLGLVDTKMDAPFANSVTDVVTNLLASDSDIELVPALIQCSLLKRERADLALELQPFSGSEPFATYVQGRVFLALKDYETAGRYFAKAAVGMAVTPPGERHSSGLLNDLDWSLLHSGLAHYYMHIVSLFDSQKAHSHVLTFSRLALQFNPQPRERVELLSRIFASATSISHFETAHNALVQMSMPGFSSPLSKEKPPAIAGHDGPLLLSSLRRLVTVMCSHQAAQELISLPFVGLTSHVDAELAARTRQTSGQEGGTPYHDILYSFRIRQGDYRGAASVLYDRICKLKRNESDRMPSPEVTGDVLDTNVTRLYLMLINTLACVGDGESGWIMAEQDVDDDDDDDDDEEEEANGRGSRGGGGVTVPASANTSFSTAAVGGGSLASAKSVSFAEGGKPAAKQSCARKRKVLTLADIRRQYQDELDRIAAIQNNQFGLELGQGGDIDMDVL